MTTITQTYAEDTKLALPARARTGGPRRPRSEQPAQQDWFERYTSQASYGSHMPLDIRFNWDWLNPLNIIQWQAPASVALGNPNFGQLREQANTMRSVQFTLRASF